MQQHIEHALALTDGLQLGAADGMRLSNAVGALIGGLGCLGANVAQTVQEIQRRLASGGIDDHLANELTGLLNDAHQDVERACRQVSRARQAISTELREVVPAADEQPATNGRART